MKKKIIALSTIIAVLVSVAYAAGVVEKIASDTLQIGLGNSVDDKQIIVDVGDGPTNPKVVINTTDKTFDFSKAITTAGNFFNVGDGANTNKVLEFDIGAGANNPKFRWNSADSALEFSTDGTNYRKIGSGTGGGGGVNLLAELNPDFEAGSPPNSWTVSGGTFIAETAAPLFGDQSGSWDASALSQTLRSTGVNVTPGMLSRTCAVEIKYKYATGTAGDYVLKIEQIDDSEGSTFDLVTYPLPLTSTGSQPATINFTCPDDVDDTLTLEIESGIANPGIILVDDAFVGTDKNTVQISQARVVAAGNWGGNCPPSTSSASFVFASALNCTAPVFNTVDASMVQQGVDYDGARVVLNNARKGTYSIKFIPLRVSQTVANTVAGYEIRANGSVISDYQFRNQDVGVDLHPFTMAGTYENQTDGASVTFDVFFNVGTGSTLMDFGKGGSSTAFEIVFFPSNANEAINLETSGGAFHVTHGNNCTFSRTNTSYGVPTGDATCTFTNQQTGGAFGTITSVLDSGNNTSGIIIQSKRSGQIFLCAITSLQESPLDSIVNARLRNQTANVVLSDIQARYQNNQANRKSGASLCGVANVVSGNNQFNVETAATGGGTAILDNAGGNYAISWFGYFIDQQFPTPVFTDLQNSLNKRAQIDANDSNKRKIVSAHITLPGSTPTISQQDGTWVASVSDLGVGTTRLTFNSGVFNTAPNCTCTTTTSAGASNDIICSYVNSTPISTQVDVVTESTSTQAPTDAPFFIICLGRTN